MTKASRTTSWVLPTIVCSQFACTSLWFAGNAVLPQISELFELSHAAVGHLTSSVQLGFILGTLVFAFFLISDRFSPSAVFMVCAVLGAALNVLCVFGTSFPSILSFRFITGFCLAGIYPVGMKIASDHFESGLGKSLGYLVGALVLGTAFPHLLSSALKTTPWQYVLYSTSALAILGGLAVWAFVPNGPYRKVSNSVKPLAVFALFKDLKFKQAAFGYFGHMWELYTFWAFVPILLSFAHPTEELSFRAFAVIAMGTGGCISAGYLARQLGTKVTAGWALALSGCCCILSGWLIHYPLASMVLLLIWGFSVVADSPLFSTLVAQNAPAQLRGSALTIVNSIGFGITIVSLQLMAWVQAQSSSQYLFLLMAFGPVFGLISMYSKRKKSN